MKRSLFLLISLLLISSVAMADHIGIYRDATGASCSLDAGFTFSTAVVHKFSLGATGSRFKVTFPAGSTFFALDTPYSGTGDFQHDYEIAYGSCMTGSFVVGSIVAILLPGILAVLPPDTFTHADVVDCSFNYVAASTGAAYVGSTNTDCGPVAAEPTTWGSLKALYR